VPGFETLKADWIGLDDAVRRVLAAAPSAPLEERPLPSAVGAVLARPVRASVSLPPFDNAAMDGYAVRQADVAGASEGSPVSLRVVRAVHAGDGPVPRSPPGARPYAS
jgi:molybdopterin molybdotransferase